MPRRYLKLTYTTEEAAEFLKVSPKEVLRLTELGHLILYSNKGHKYYLGGGLDAIEENAKSMLEADPGTYADLFDV